MRVFLLGTFSKWSCFSWLHIRSCTHSCCPQEQDLPFIFSSIASLSFLLPFRNIRSLRIQHYSIIQWLKSCSVSPCVGASGRGSEETLTCLLSCASCVLVREAMPVLSPNTGRRFMLVLFFWKWISVLFMDFLLYNRKGGVLLFLHPLSRPARDASVAHVSAASWSKSQRGSGVPPRGFQREEPWLLNESVYIVTFCMCIYTQWM